MPYSEMPSRGTVDPRKRISPDPWALRSDASEVRVIPGFSGLPAEAESLRVISFADLEPTLATRLSSAGRFVRCTGRLAVGSAEEFGEVRSSSLPQFSHFRAFAEGRVFPGITGRLGPWRWLARPKARRPCACVLPRFRDQGFFKRFPNRRFTDGREAP